MLRLAALFFMTFCSILSAPAFAKTLRIGVGSDLSDFFPIHQKVGSSNYTRSLTLPPIVAVDQNQKWTCIICLELPSLENNKLVIEDLEDNHKQMRTFWELSSNFNWSDGKPLTAYDLKFTLDHMIAEKSISPEFQINVNLKNPRKFEIIFNGIQPDFYQLLAISLLPHGKSKSLEKMSTKKEMYETLNFSSGIYYGSYLVKQISETGATLNHNPHFKGLKNDFEIVELVVLDSLPKTIALLKEKSIDIVADGAINHRQAMQIMKEEGIRSFWKLKYNIGTKVDMIQFNLKNPYLADQNVRLAFFLALDRGSLLADLFDNFGAIAPIPPFYPESLHTKVELYNVKEARRLLKSSGWILNDSFRSKNGVKLDFDLELAEGNIKKKMAERIQSYLADVGIRINIKVHESNTEFVQDILQKGFFRDMALVTYKIFPQMNIRHMYHSEFIPAADNKYQGNNYSFWANKGVDQILDKLDVELDPGKRSLLYGEFNLAFSDNLPAIPLLNRPVFTLLSNRVVNIRFPGKSYHSSLYSSSWITRDEPKDVF